MANSKEHKYVMGINLSSHDRSVCLLEDERIACAISEERLDRRKRSEIFFKLSAPTTIFEVQTLLPMRSVTYCLEAVGIGIDDVDLFVVGRSIFSAKESVVQSLPIKDKSKIVEIPLPNHHLAHAYSAYFCSPYKESAILVIDEQGSWFNKTTYEKHSLYYAKGTKISLIKNFQGSKENGSLGVFYDYFCALLGLFENGRFPAAGKLMALAAYGKMNPSIEPILKYLPSGDVGFSYRDIKRLCDKVGIDYQYNKKKVDRIYETGLSYFSFLNIPYSSPLAHDLAYFAQKELEKGVLHIANHLTHIQPSQNLCYAGGVALNCVVNSRILPKTTFKDLFILPAATDDGTAIGYAYYGLYNLYKGSKRFLLETAYLGKDYNEEIYRNHLDMEPFHLKTIRPDKDFIRHAAELLAKGNIIGWYQGRSEFGPRALGNRSILAHPGIKGIKDAINLKIKKRESFRPFAPVILEEETAHYFETKHISPFMLLSFKIKSEYSQLLSEIVHFDGTSRIQTINKSQNPLLFALLKEFKKLTGLPLLLNTSFNSGDEPIVEKPRDALRTFFKTDLDCLVLGEYLIEKSLLSKQRVQKIQETLDAAEPINYLKAGHSARTRGFFQDAIIYYQQALSLSYLKDEYPIRLGLAQSNFALSHFAEAAKNAGTAINLDPHKIEPYVIAAKSYRQLSQNDLSLNTLEEGVVHNPKQGVGYVELALLYIEKKKYNKAMMLLKEAIDLKYRLDMVFELIDTIKKKRLSSF